MTEMQGRATGELVQVPACSTPLPNTLVTSRRKWRLCADLERVLGGALQCTHVAGEFPVTTRGPGLRDLYRVLACDFAPCRLADVRPRVACTPADQASRRSPAVRGALPVGRASHPADFLCREPL